jgi:hypothetical protein
MYVKDSPENREDSWKNKNKINVIFEIIKLIFLIKLMNLMR